jgi:hypothetical protein
MKKMKKMKKMKSEKRRASHFVEAFFTGSLGHAAGGRHVTQGARHALQRAHLGYISVYSCVSPSA